MVMYREVCPEGVQNKCPGGVWCRGFMSWGDTLILVISRGVQLYYGIAHCYDRGVCLAPPPHTGGFMSARQLGTGSAWRNGYILVQAGIYRRARRPAACESNNTSV